MKVDGGFLKDIRFDDDISECTGTPQELQHMFQELSDESSQMGMNVMVVDNSPVYVKMLKTTYTRATLQHRGKYSLQRDTRKSQCRLGVKRQTPGSLQKQYCNLPEETGMEYNSSYDMVCSDMDTHKTTQNRPKWKEVCSTSHTTKVGPTFELEREQKHHYT